MTGSAVPLQPLRGLTVVSLEQAVAAPFATRQLADLGARVIKVERPGTGDFARGYDTAVGGLSSYFVWLNRSKESVVLDLKSETGREALHRLVRRADVVVQNLGPGAATRLGIDAATVHAQDPSTILLSITGWGRTGPWADRKAYDLLVQCETGLVSLTGTAEEAARVGVSIADIAAGVYGFSAVLAALLERNLTGRGTDLEISLLDALGEWMGQPALYTAGLGTQPGRAGVSHPTIAPYGQFMTRDGRAVLLAVQNDTEWRSLCTHVLGSPELADDERWASNPARVRNRDALDKVVGDRVAQLDANQVDDLLEEARIAHAGVRSVTDFLQHPALVGRQRWQPVATPGGPVDVLLPPYAADAGSVRLDPVPALGEHTDAVLSELGFDDAERAEMIELDT